MPEPPWDQPEADHLRRYVDRVLQERGEEVEFVVLFGSRARGDWTRGSDFDVLVGLRQDDGKRWVDRLVEWEATEGNVEVFPYARGEWQRMFEDRHLLLLDALEHGVVLWDRGSFKRMRATFRRWREEGLVVPWRSGWRIR